MTRFNSTRAVLSTMAVLALGACKDLDVTNVNNPDITRALASPEDVRNLAISTINSWYLTSTDIYPYAMLEVTADQMTANFGNFGMRFNNLEPRKAYDNNSAGGDRDVAESPWDNNYGTLGAANDVLKAINSGVVIDDAATTEKYRVLAKFAQAASFANLGLIFDQAFITDETFIPGESAVPDATPYTDVVAAAVASFDNVISSTASVSEVYDATEFPLVAGLNSAALNRIANTMAAWTLASSARTAAENAATNWGQVLAYAEKGISGPQGLGPAFDFTIQGDGGNNWYSYIVLYGDLRSWMKVDMRVICRLDPTQPCKYNGTLPPPATGPDKRVLSDIKFDKVIGDPNRGIFMQSPYHHTRYRDHSFEVDPCCTTPVPYILAAENDLLIAEALARTGGDLGRVASLINTTRVGRGGLPPATAGDGAATLLNMIEYERDIELMNTNGGALYSRRRVDGLQPGTVRHLPVPAKELETLQLPVYTFGGSGPDMVIIAPTGEEIGLRKTPTHRSPANSIRWLKPQR